MKNVYKNRLILLVCMAMFMMYTQGCTTDSTSSTDTEDDDDSTVNSVTFTISGDIRTIVSNSIPDHGLDADQDYPNALVAQDFTFTMDYTPTVNETTTSFL
jgi:hypothetical protein